MAAGRWWKWVRTWELGNSFPGAWVFDRFSKFCWKCFWGFQAGRWCFGMFGFFEMGSRHPGACPKNYFCPIPAADDAWQKGRFCGKRITGGDSEQGLTVMGIWLVLDWYMIGIWLVYDWYMIGKWLVYDWYLIGIWLVYYRYMIGIWLVSDWYMIGIWLVYDWYMIGIWLVSDWYMIGIWLVSDWYIIGILSVYGWYMVGIWLVSDWYLIGIWLMVGKKIEMFQLLEMIPGQGSALSCWWPLSGRHHQTAGMRSWPLLSIWRRGYLPTGGTEKAVTWKVAAILHSWDRKHPKLRYAEPTRTNCCFASLGLVAARVKSLTATSNVATGSLLPFRHRDSSEVQSLRKLSGSQDARCECLSQVSDLHVDGCREGILQSEIIEGIWTKATKTGSPVIVWVYYLSKFGSSQGAFRCDRTICYDAVARSRRHQVSRSMVLLAVDFGRSKLGKNDAKRTSACKSPWNSLSHYTFPKGSSLFLVPLIFLDPGKCKGSSGLCSSWVLVLLQNRGLRLWTLCTAPGIARHEP